MDDNVQITVNISVDLLKQIDDFATKYLLSRDDVISMLCRHRLIQYSLLPKQDKEAK